MREAAAVATMMLAAPLKRIRVVRPSLAMAESAGPGVRVFRLGP